MAKRDDETEVVIRTFDPSRVRPLPGQPRKRFRRIEELAKSIKRVGQSQAGKVTLVRGDPDFDAQLVDGERRLRACLLAGVKFRAVVEADGSPAEIFKQSFAANFGREPHDVIEIAHALQRMRDEGETQESMAEIAGMSTGWVQQHLSINKLDPAVQAMMVPDDDDAAKLAFQVAILLAPFAPKDQVRLAKHIVKLDMPYAKARRYVLRERDAAGVKMKGRGRHRKRTMGSLSSIIEDIGDKLGVFEDMPAAELNTLIDALPGPDKVQLSEQLRELALTCGSMADSFEQRMTALRKAG